MTNEARPQPRRGYLLLAVIAVLILVVTSLSTLARLSLRKGLEAADAERSLQQRWGALTIERALLPQAAGVFQRQEDALAETAPGTPTAAAIRTSVKLGESHFDVLLGDEDAKLNLNAVYHHGGSNRTDQALTQIGGPAITLARRLRPAVAPLRQERMTARNASSQTGREEEDDAMPELPDAFRSWGEILDLTRLEAGIARDASLPNLTTGLTCWGNGQLNLRRASDDAILALTRVVIQDGAARRIVQRFRQNPTSTLALLLQTEVSREEDRQRLAELMSETSTNFSIWIDVFSPGGGSLRSFSVMRRDEEGVIRQTKFLH